MSARTRITINGTAVLGTILDVVEKVLVGLSADAFGSGTHLVVVLLVGVTSSKRPQALSFPIGMG